MITQLALPPIAAHVLRGRLSKDGQVQSVSISAFPAVELLWHDAGTVNVRMGSYHPTVSKLGNVLSQTDGVGNLNVQIGTLHTGLMTIHDVALRKQNGELHASARVLETDLQAAFGGLVQSVVPVASSGGAVTLRGTVVVPLIGTHISADVTVGADAGKITADIPIHPLTVWSDPRVHVDSVAGAPAPGGMSVTATATVR